MLGVTHLVGFGAGGGVVTPTFNVSAIDTADLATYTFASITFLAGKTVVAVSVAGNVGANPVTSMTINGVAATAAIQLNYNSNNAAEEIWYADGVSAGSGSVVVNFASASLRCGIGVWNLAGAASGAASSTLSSAAAPPSGSITIPGDGAAVFGSGNYGASCAWTNATERYDEVVEGGAPFHQSGADRTTAGAVTITATWTSQNAPAMVGAAWGPG